MSNRGSKSKRRARRPGPHRSSGGPAVIDTSGLERLGDLFSEAQSGIQTGSVEDALIAQEKAERFCIQYPHELANVRRQIAGEQSRGRSVGTMGALIPVAVNGSRAQGANKGYFKTPLHDGTAGYFQRRSDDCLQAAIASLLQVPPYLVPDLQIDQQRMAGKEPEQINAAVWQKMGPWIEKNAVTIMLHTVVPTSERRWIGVVKGAMGSTTDHCLLMSGRDCLFDVANLVPPGKDEPVSPYGHADIAYGITIERR